MREAWRRVCEETSAQHIERGFWGGDRIELKFQSWEIVLDAYTPIHTVITEERVTRIRAPFVSRDGFRFKVCRRGFWSKLAKCFGARYIETGDREFDRRFIVRSNDGPLAVRLLSSPRIRELFHAQPQIDLQIRDDGGFGGGYYPENVDVLYFSVAGVIEDSERLKSLFDLFGEVLITLVELGIAENAAPEVGI